MQVVNFQSNRQMKHLGMEKMSYESTENILKLSIIIIPIIYNKREGYINEYRITKYYKTIHSCISKNILHYKLLGSRKFINIVPF